MKILLLGDMSPTENNFDLFDKADTDKLFGDAASIFKGNDFNLINLEVALTESGKCIEKYGPCLKAPVSTAKRKAALLRSNISLIRSRRKAPILAGIKRQ